MSHEKSPLTAGTIAGGGREKATDAGDASTREYSTNGSDPQVTTLTFAAEDIERAVLGALLVDPAAYGKIKGWCFSDHFQIARWRWVFESICDLRDAGLPADFVTVPDELERRGRLREIGGAPTVMELGVDNGDPWNVVDYAKRLVERSVKARGVDLLSQGIRELHRNGASSDALERIVAAVEDLKATHITASDFDAEPTADGTMLERLIVPMPEIAGLGLVAEIADLIGLQTGSARAYCLLTALTVTAAATRRTARLRMGFGDIFPNLYAALLGASSVHHKSTVMGAGRDLLYRAQLTDLLVPANPTSEGLLNRLADKPSGVIFKDEIGTLFGANQVKYLAMLKQDLMALYDCRPYGRELARGEVRVDTPFLSILGTTTPRKFFDTVSHSDWHDGFLVRWLIALPDCAPDLDNAIGLLDESLDKRQWSLAMRLGALARRSPTDLAFDADAFQTWDAWRRGRLKRAYQAGDDLGLYLSERYAANALKIGILLALANDTASISGGIITAAIALAEHFETCLLTLREARQDYGVSGGKMQRVFAVIRDKGPNVLTRNVYRLSHLPKAEVEPVLDKLLEIGAVIEKQAAGGGKTYSAATDRLPIKVW